MFVIARPARLARSTRKMPTPSPVPSSAPTIASTEAITVIWPGVAPASRSAAYRCSRRAAASREAVPMRMRIGNRNAIAATRKASRKYGDQICLPGAVAIASTRKLPGTAASSAGRWPMTTTSSVGPVSPGSPMVPASRPGNLSPSSSAGMLRSSAASAGEAKNSPLFGSAPTPGGIGAPGPSAARSSRSIVRPANMSFR